MDGLLASSLPTVLIGHRRADRSASYVDVDHVQAADSVTSHLVDARRRRIGHITGRRGTVAGEDRIVGYQRAMERARLSDGGAHRRRGRSARHRGRRRPSSCSTAASMRSSARTTRRPRARSRRSAPAGSAYRRTWRSRASTTWSSPRSWIPADHGSPGDPRTGGGGGQHARTALGRSRRRSAPRHPSHGAGHPAFHRGRRPGAVNGKTGHVKGRKEGGCEPGHGPELVSRDEYCGNHGRKRGGTTCVDLVGWRSWRSFC